MQHYFSGKPESESNPRLIEYAVGDRKLKFMTDSGVFSKSGVDRGSGLLINTAISQGYQGKVLDLGCGYGAVGVSLLAHNPGICLLMADINERAVSLSTQNLEINFGLDLSGREKTNGDIAKNDANASLKASVLLSDGFSEIKRLFPGTAFDYIYLNPPIRAGKGTVFRLYGESLGHLAKGGRLYVVIQKKQGMESTRKELERVFGNCERVAGKSGFGVLRSVKA